MRRRATVLALLVAAVTALGPVGPAAADQPSNVEALSALGACARADKRLDMVVLLDESGSLRSTDPQSQRVLATRFLLRQLADTAERRRLRIDVQLAGFSADYQPVGSWTTLTPSTAGRLLSAADSFRAKNSGIDTDYWSALAGARRAFTDHARESGYSGRCRALFWLSDGELDIDPRRTSSQRDAFGDSKPYAPGVDLTTDAGAERAKRSALASLCRNGGLVDQLRTANITTIGVGLAPGASVPDFSLMTSVATGAPDGPSCGRPVQAPAGAFYLARSIDDLLLTIEDVLNPRNGPQPPSAGICVETLSDDCVHSFVLDDSVRHVHIFAQSPLDDVTLVLQPPDGSAELRTSSSQTAPQPLPGVKAAWETGRTATFELDRDTAAGWRGQWRLYFFVGRDRAAEAKSLRSLTRVDISGDLVPVWRNQKDVTLRAGTKAAVELGLARDDGTPVDPAELLGTASLTAELVTADGTRLPVLPTADVRSRLAPIQLDLAKTPPGAATLNLTLRVTTAGVPASGDRPAVPGTQLNDVQTTVSTVVEAPFDYPAVPASVDLGAAEKNTATVSGGLSVSGKGCVWLVRSESLNLPDRASSATVTSADATSRDSCLRVPAGGSVDLPLSLALDVAGTGAADGRLVVATVPDGDGPVVERTVTYHADFLLVSQRVLWLTFVVALVLGLGVPLGLAYVLRWWSARMPGTVPVVLHTVPVRVEGGQVVLTDGAPFALSREGDGTVVPLQRSGERALQAGICTLRARAGWNIAQAPGVEVTSGNRHTVAPPGLRGGKAGARARLPLDIHNRWVAVVDAASVTVVALPSSLADAAVRQRIVDSVAQELPRLLDDLQTRYPDPSGDAGPSASPEDDPWGDGRGRTIVLPTDTAPVRADPWADGAPDPWSAPPSSGPTADGNGGWPTTGQGQGGGWPPSQGSQGSPW